MPKSTPFTNFISMTTWRVHHQIIKQEEDFGESQKDLEKHLGILWNSFGKVFISEFRKIILNQRFVEKSLSPIRLNCRKFLFLQVKMVEYWQFPLMQFISRISRGFPCQALLFINVRTRKMSRNNQRQILTHILIILQIYRQKIIA